MDVAALPLPAAWTVAGWVVAVPLFAWGALRGDWSRFRESAATNAFLGAVFALCVLWSVRGEVGRDFAFHLLGTGGLALAAGLPRALVGGAVVVAATTLIRDAPLANAALVWLTLVALPAAVARGFLALTERVLPPNFFVYVFAGCFLGGALALAAGGLAGATITVLGAGSPFELVFGERAPFLIYLAFGEGTLTGMILTLLVVYRPEGVATFDDRRYLIGR
jgi:uncharacterized membrane protein